MHRCLSRIDSSIQKSSSRDQLVSVLPCHCLPLLPCWVNDEPVCNLQMSVFLLYHLLHESVGNTLHWGSREMGVLLGYQIWKINFLVWKHDMVVSLNVMEWEHSYFHSHFHTQYLLMRVLIKRHHSMWSQSNQIILLPVVVAGQSHYRRWLCTLSWWWCWASKGPSHLSKTVVQQLRCSIWRIHKQMAVFSSIHGEESSWCKLDCVMIYELICLRFILRSDSNSVNVS